MENCIEILCIMILQLNL